MAKKRLYDESCHCKKCDASIDPADEKCPNGHVLKDVGIIYKLILRESIGLSASFSIEDKKIIEDLLKVKTQTAKKISIHREEIERILRG